MYQAVLVILHVAHCTDTRLQWTQFYRRGAHTQVIYHLRRNLYSSRAFTRNRALCIDRQQIHTHRRLTRLAAPVIGIHRCHPVQRLLAGSSVLATRLIRFITQLADKECAKGNTYQQGQYISGDLFHDSTPSALLSSPAKK